MTSAFGLVCLVVFVAAVGVDAYTNRYDGFDIDSVMKSERMYRSYLNCFLDQGPCSPMAEEGKQLIPEIINTSCAKCSPHQKYLICKVFKIILEQKPDDLKKLLAKYDPQNQHYQDLINFVKENENNKPVHY